MKYYTTIFILFLNFIALSYSNESFQLIKLTEYSEAKCLDGSPPAIYWREGSGDNKNKFIFYFQGGGWCSGLTLDDTITSCINRSKNNLGSSKNYASTKTLDGIFSSDSDSNPHFYNYSQVYVNYCDGTGHQGYKQNSFQEGSDEIWFRGTKNTEAALDYAVKNLGMDLAQQVLVMGGSIGGVSCFTWVDYISDYFDNSNNNTDVVGACDSGIILDYKAQQSGDYEYRTRIKNFMQLSNDGVNPINQNCANAFPQDLWKCFIPEYLINYISTRTLILQSQYDSFIIGSVIKVPCLKNQSLSNCDEDEKDYIENYREAFIKSMQNSISDHSNLGLWSPSCVIHIFTNKSAFNSKDWEVPTGSGQTASKAIYDFQSGKEVNQYDDSWPSNSPCSNQSQIIQQLTLISLILLLAMIF